VYGHTAGPCPRQSRTRTRRLISAQPPRPSDSNGRAPLVAATATLAAPLVHDGAITEAYRRWQKHYRAIQASPTGPTDYDDWDIVCDAEKVILGNADSSPRATEMRLWVLLGNMSCDVGYVLGEDIQSLVGDDGLDWDVKFAVRALADVRRLAGGR
jgi:hypothetical protein